MIQPQARRRRRRRDRETREKFRKHPFPARGKLVELDGGVRWWGRVTAGLILATFCVRDEAARASVQTPHAPTFRTSIDLVTVTAVVRDRRGRLVRNLSRSDFELFDAGEPRPISEFRVEPAPVSVALLVDVSGSMEVGTKRDSARLAAHHVLSWLESGKDQAALFAFDARLHEIHDFTTAVGDLHDSIDRTDPYGVTSLHDAIAETARRIIAEGGPRRAVVVLTDGVDTSSRLTAPEVSGIASAIDVPVYIIAVVSPVDHPGGRHAVVEAATPVQGALADLARWTGGRSFIASAPSHASIAARQIIEELRHQYVLAFEPSGQPGWHPLEVRVRDKDLIVHARSGYLAGPGRPADQP